MSVQEIVAKCSTLLYDFTIVDKNGCIIYISERYAEKYGISRQEAIGQKIESVIPNTKFYDTLAGKTDLNDLFEAYNGGPAVICNRLPIRNQYSEIIGAISISGNLQAEDTVDTLFHQLKKLQDINAFYVKQLNGLEEAPSVMSSIVGTSPKIMEIKRTLLKIANSRMPILLTGESGCGKEVFANAINKASNRRDRPFVKVNCAAIPKDLLESEMFGYESGTFTGAIRGGKKGKFELANNGTILLDEVEALPMEMQAKLLRVLQEYEVQRIGSVQPIPLNIQLICCSNQNLYDMVARHLFREDFLYRINAIEVEIPPLRERMEDIPALCGSLIEKINKKYKLNIKGLTSSALSLLSSYLWPGNVRELEHALEQACVISDADVLTHSDFRFLEQKQKQFFSSSDSQFSDPEQGPFFQRKAISERDTILYALRQCGGNRTQAAKQLGISRSLLYVKLKKYSIS